MSDESKTKSYERITTHELDIYLNPFVYLIQYDKDNDSPIKRNDDSPIERSNSNVRIHIDDFPCEERLNLGVMMKYFDLHLVDYYDEIAGNTCYLNKLRNECTFVLDITAYKNKFLPLFGSNTQKYFNTMLNKK